jgi:hypothetical protein
MCAVFIIHRDDTVTTWPKQKALTKIDEGLRY